MKKTKATNEHRGRTTVGKSTKKGGKPKRFTVKVKRRDPVEDSERRLTGPNSAASLPFEQALIGYVQAAGLPDVSAKYAALCGADRPVEKALASDRVSMMEAQSAVGRDLQNYLAADPPEVAVQYTRVGVVAARGAEISLRDGKKANAIYERAKIDGMSGIRFCAVPQAGTNVPGIAIDLVTVMLGRDVQAKLDASARRARVRDSFERSPIRMIGSGGTQDLESVLGSLFSAPFNRLPQFDPLGARYDDFGKDSESGLRAVVTLMCRSQLPLRNMLMGFGGGRRIVKRALANVDDSLKLRCRAAPEILHPGVVIHFWYSEVHRLGWDHISVPIVKLR